MMDAVIAVEQVPAIFLAVFLIIWGIAMLCPIYREFHALRSPQSNDRKQSHTNASPKKDLSP